MRIFSLFAIILSIGACKNTTSKVKEGEDSSDVSCAFLEAAAENLSENIVNDLGNKMVRCGTHEGKIDVSASVAKILTWNLSASQGGGFETGELVTNQKLAEGGRPITLSTDMVRGSRLNKNMSSFRLGTIKTETLKLVGIGKIGEQLSLSCFEGNLTGRECGSKNAGDVFSWPLPAEDFVTGSSEENECHFEGPCPGQNSDKNPRVKVRCSNSRGTVMACMGAIVYTNGIYSDHWQKPPGFWIYSFTSKNEIGSCPTSVKTQDELQKWKTCGVTGFIASSVKFLDGTRLPNDVSGSESSKDSSEPKKDEVIVTSEPKKTTPAVETQKTALGPCAFNFSTGQISNNNTKAVVATVVSSNGGFSTSEITKNCEACSGEIISNLKNSADEFPNYCKKK